MPFKLRANELFDSTPAANRRELLNRWRAGQALGAVAFMFAFLEGTLRA